MAYSLCCISTGESNYINIHLTVGTDYCGFSSFHRLIITQAMPTNHTPYLTSACTVLAQSVGDEAITARGYE